MKACIAVPYTVFMICTYMRTINMVLLYITQYAHTYSVHGGRQKEFGVL